MYEVESDFDYKGYRKQFIVNGYYLWLLKEQICSFFVSKINRQSYLILGCDE